VSCPLTLFETFVKQQPDFSVTYLLRVLEFNECDCSYEYLWQWDYPFSILNDSIESIQKRALRIIYSFSNDVPYCNSFDVADIASLSTRRNELSHKFFHSIAHPSSSLHSLLPPPQDPDLLARV